MALSASHTALRAKTSDWRGLVEARLVAIEDGPGRGQRLLLLRNAAAVECEIAMDRGFDVAALRWRGSNLGWNGPVGGGLRARELECEEGLGLLRSFDGFLVTCGLDHYGTPTTGPADHFIYPHRLRTHHPLHGRISSQCATLRSYGLDTESAIPGLWCEAVVRQAAVFGEVLSLHRRIELPMFEPLIRIHDRVVNEGWRPTRHGMLYHINVGYPLLDEGTVLTGDFGKQLLADFTAAPPIARADVRERFDARHAHGDALGRARAGVFNPGCAGGTALTIEYSANTLPGLGLWRAWQSGIYALGIEPNSDLPPEVVAYRGPGTPHYLEAGEARDYQFDIRLAGPIA